MKAIKLLVPTTILLALACTKDEPIHQEPANLTEAIENIIQPMVDDKTTVGAAIGIIRPGGEKEMFFFGEKTKDKGDKPDENTLFEIGSINKTMTTAILADMVLNGEVSLDDAVENQLPGVTSFPQYNGEKITFKHLANHTSSLPRIPNNTDNGSFDEDNPFANYSETELYGFLNSYTLPRAIGSEYEYSNLAFGLLGHTLGEMRGTSFESQIQQVVFDRLGMSNTDINIPSENNNVAQPYDHRRKAVPAFDFADVFLGAGGANSSLKDMLIYLEANMGYGDSDLKDALALAHQITYPVNEPSGTGLAWVIGFRAEDNLTLTGHNGGTAGSVAFIGFVKELHIGVVLLFNCEIIQRNGEMGIESRKGIEIIDAIIKY